MPLQFGEAFILKYHETGTPAKAVKSHTSMTLDRDTRNQFVERQLIAQLKRQCGLEADTLNLGVDRLLLVDGPQGKTRTLAQKQAPLSTKALKGLQPKALVARFKTAPETGGTYLQNGPELVTQIMRALLAGRK